jgi:hypothetical protein
MLLCQYGNDDDNIIKNNRPRGDYFLCIILQIGTGGRTRTYEGLRREIYSLLSLPLDDSGL